jgi:hypothetical protein
MLVDIPMIVSSGKGGKKRTVYLNKELRKQLKKIIEFKEKTLHQAIDPEAPLFSGREGKQSPPITLMS